MTRLEKDLRRAGAVLEVARHPARALLAKALEAERAHEGLAEALQRAAALLEAEAEAARNRFFAGNGGGNGSGIGSGTLSAHTTFLQFLSRVGGGGGGGIGGVGSAAFDPKGIQTVASATVALGGGEGEGGASHASFVPIARFASGGGSSERRPSDPSSSVSAGPSPAPPRRSVGFSASTFGGAGVACDGAEALRPSSRGGSAPSSPLTASARGRTSLDEQQQSHRQQRSRPSVSFGAARSFEASSSHHHHPFEAGNPQQQQQARGSGFGGGSHNLPHSDDVDAFLANASSAAAPSAAPFRRTASGRIVLPISASVTAPTVATLRRMNSAAIARRQSVAASKALAEQLSDGGGEGVGSVGEGGGGGLLRQRSRERSPSEGRASSHHHSPIPPPSRGSDASGAHHGLGLLAATGSRLPVQAFASPPPEIGSVSVGIGATAPPHSDATGGSDAKGSSVVNVSASAARRRSTAAALTAVLALARIRLSLARRASGGGATGDSSVSPSDLAAAEPSASAASLAAAMHRRGDDGAGGARRVGPSTAYAFPTSSPPEEAVERRHVVPPQPLEAAVLKKTVAATVGGMPEAYSHGAVVERVAVQAGDGAVRKRDSSEAVVEGSATGRANGPKASPRLQQDVITAFGVSAPRGAASNGEQPSLRSTFPPIAPAKGGQSTTPLAVAAMRRAAEARPSGPAVPTVLPAIPLSPRQAQQANAGGGGAFGTAGSVAFSGPPRIGGSLALSNVGSGSFSARGGVAPFPPLTSRNGGAHQSASAFLGSGLPPAAQFGGAGYVPAPSRAAQSARRPHQ